MALRLGLREARLALQHHREGKCEARGQKQNEESGIVSSGRVEDKGAAISAKAAEDLVDHRDQSAEGTQLNHSKMVTDEQHDQGGRDKEGGAKHQRKDC